MPHDNELSPQSRRILGILREHGDWMTRTELASALQHNELSTYHMKLLKQLSDDNLIEVRKYRTSSWQLTYQ